MNQRMFARVVLSLVCAIAVASIPAWAQSSTTVPQQDQTDRNTVNQDNQNVNQDNRVDSDADQDLNREKPSTTEQNSTQPQNSDLNRDNNENTIDTKSTTEPQRTYQEDATSPTPQSTDSQTGESREGLPATAGELPLLGLIGILLLASAAGTRFLARARR